MLEANRIVLAGIGTRIEGEVDDKSRIEGDVVIGRGRRVIASTLRGPLIIGENCVIEDAFVGPFTSIHNGAVIRGSVIGPYATIAEGATVEYSIIRNSIINEGPVGPVRVNGGGEFIVCQEGTAGYLRR